LFGGISSRYLAEIEMFEEHDGRAVLIVIIDY
jgi:hypothetical protein